LKILLIEDDIQIGQGLLLALKNASYSVNWVRNGDLGRDAVKNGSYTAILLDLGLPGMSGLDLLLWLRGANDATPVLVITALDDVDTRVVGLDLGADDYLIKPIESKELLARIRAVVRRKSGFASATMGNGRVTLDMNLRQLSFDGHAEEAFAREYALMMALLERPGAILSRQQLEERLYGWGEEVESNAVDAVIYSVRRKFGNGVIRNVRGLGWTVSRRRLDCPRCIARCTPHAARRTPRHCATHPASAGRRHASASATSAADSPAATWLSASIAVLDRLRTSICKRGSVSSAASCRTTPDLTGHMSPQSMCVADIRSSQSACMSVSNSPACSPSRSESRSRSKAASSSLPRWPSASRETATIRAAACGLLHR
jgi:two-component system OmpR family response regulator